MGGIPFISMEVPASIEFEQLRKLLQEYEQLVTDPEEVEEFIRTNKMNVERMFTADGRLYSEAPYTPFARNLLLNICKHGAQMFLARLTFGLFGTAKLLVTLRLDWDDPVHPSRHLYISVYDCETNTAIPEWDPTCTADIQDGQLGVTAGVGALQLEQGLLPLPEFERALVHFARTHGLYIPTPQTDDSPNNGADDNGNGGSGEGGGSSGSGGNSSGAIGNSGHDDSNGRTSRYRAAKDPKKRKAPYEEPSSDQEGGTDAEQDTDNGSSPPYTLRFPAEFSAKTRSLFQRFVDALTDPAGKEEVQRYLDLDETRYALPFPKQELLRVLAVSFPLDIQATLRLPGNEKLTAKTLRNEVRYRPARLPVEYYLNISLFHWHSLREGYLPTAFQDGTVRSAVAESAQPIQTTQVGSPPRYA